ncbi:DUF6551 family protein [Streptomyces sp. NPDC057686]|uniref:DUF6551 family protein n=1 Tax=Streptomyces sp. NPDC057686 TaxID=3346212 RepID=UPI00368A88A1
MNEFEKTDMARVRRIVAQFDPKLFDPITITFRDGAYWVVDGAHRLAAAKMLGTMGDPNE